MASSCEASCISDPNFAVICAFLERFASSCGIEFPTFVDLQEMLENVDQVPQELIDLHIKLLRKARKTVFIEKWERALIKFCHTYSSQDGWEIERFGYKKSRLEVKIRVLKMLLEGQFDLNQKFKAQINTQESGELRTKPLGKDKLGRLYWLQTDPVSNIRVYREDMDEESWTLVAKDRPTLVELLQELSGEESPLDLNLLNEDSASLDVDKPVTDTGQNENGTIKSDNDISDEKVGVNGEVKSGSEKVVNNDLEKEIVNGEIEKEVVNGDSEKEARIYDVDKNVENKIAIEESEEVGEAIEEPVMYVTGEGAGADCEAGNPDKEEEQNEHVEESTPNTSEHDLPSEKQKPTPKLWSIDTICGVNSTEVNEVKHKNFSSFSIDSVLEKKDSDATFSKYTVNCPIESNSIGGEQTSDEHLKTDINSDTIPYREASVSESEVRTPSDDLNKIESYSENAGNVDSSLVKPNAEMPHASNQSDTDNNKSLEGTTQKTAKPNVQETAIEIDLSVEEVKNPDLIENKSTNEANKLINNVKDKTEEVFTVPLEPEVKPKVEERTDSLNDNDSVLDNELQKVSENQESKNESQAKPEEQTFETVNDTLKEVEVETEVKVPKLPEEKKRGELLNISEVFEDKEAKNQSTADTQKENHLVTVDENISKSERAVVQEVTNTDEANERNQTNLNETTATLEEFEQVKKTATSEETEIPEKIVQEVKLEDESVRSKIEEIEITESAEGEILECEETEKMNVSVTITKLEEPEVNKETVKQHTEKKQEQMEVDYGIKTVKEKPSKESTNIEENVRESLAEQSFVQDVREEEKNKDNKNTDNVKIELIENHEERIEGKQKQKALDERESAVVEIAVQQDAVDDSPRKEDKSVDEKLIEEELSNNVKLEEETVETATEERCTDESDGVKQDENKKEEIAGTEETTEAQESSETKDKKIKRELLVAIEKMETVPEIKKEDGNEKSVEKDIKPTSSTKAAEEEEVEKDEEKEGKEEDVVQSKNQKQEVRRLSRNRKGPEETTKVEETPRMTRGMRKSVGLEETPKQNKARKGRKNVKEEEKEEEDDDDDNDDDDNDDDDDDDDKKEEKNKKGNDTELKEEQRNVVKMKESEENNVEIKEVDETAKDEDVKSEEEEEEEEGGGGEEKEKDKGPQKPQGRRGRRRRRRRVFTLTRRKPQDVNEKEDGKEDDKKPEDEKNKENKENQEKKERKRRRKRDEATLLRERAAQELKLLGATEDSETPTIRQSRRIAQIKLKEEAERRRLEALQLESFKKEKDKKGKKKKKSNHDSDSGDEDKKDKDDDEDSDDEMTKKERKRRKKKDKLKFNELNPWLSSTESSTVDEEEEELEDEPHEDDELVFKSDHEFSPESDVEDPDYKPIKRARTAKVEESEEKGGKYDDTACEKCGNKDHPEWILLCDKCDKGWHASCVRPALMVVPEGDWFCPPCEHIFLIEKLKQSLAQYDRTQKQRENEELRRKRLAFVGISLDNVLPPAKKISKDEKEEDDDDEKSVSESSSESESSESDSGSSDSAEPVYQLRERRANVTSYRYNEYDELIKSALKDEIEATKGAGNAGRGKDINNIVNAEKQNENENLEDKREVSEKEENGTQEEKPKQRSKKEDGDYDAETEEEEEEENEEDENVVDEIPPVVPKNTGLKKKKSKSVKITSLDFTSEEEDDNNSDSDFKGTSDEEESECSLPSESESSEEIGRRRKGYDGPVRRSTRARISRYDRDFINDDSEDDEPKRKRRRSWESSESSDSDRSWGKKKRKKGGSTSRAKRFPSEKKKKKKQKKRPLNSDDEEHGPPKKYKSRKVIYGGLDEEPILTRRTRGKKINYQEMNGSDSEDDQPKKASSRVIESDDDFVAENDKDEEEQNVESEEIESGVDEDEDTDVEKEKKPIEKKKKILEKIKKKKWVIPDPDDFSEDDLMEEKQLDELNEELEDLDEEEEEILGNMLEKGDVPINELRDAVKQAKEERKKKKETEKSDPETLPRTFPPIPTHMEFGSGKFPKIGKVKITPSRAELASMGGLPQQGTLSSAGVQPGLIPTGYPTTEKQEDKLVIPLRPVQNEKGLGDPNIPANHSKPEQRLYPYQMEAPPPAGPLTMMAMMNSQQRGDSSIGAKNGPPLYPYQGMGEYPPNIPTTVMGISDIEAQGKKKPGPKPGTKMKKKVDDPSLKDGDDNAGSGDEFKMEAAKGARKGKKSEGEGVSTVQPPTQFPPAESGSVITRMLNAPQYESNQFGLRNPPFRPIHFATPPRPPPPIRVRVAGPMFHTSHPHDPSPSGGGPINIPSTKPSPPSPTFNRGQVPVMQRFPDPRFALQSAPSRPEFSTYSGFYGNYPQPEEASFQNPPPSYPEQFPEGAPLPPKSFDDETGGEFGGLASYFASQREEDLDT